MDCGIQVPSSCLLCAIGTECMDHLFFQCEYAKEVWEFFFATTSFAPPLDFTNALLWSKAPSPNDKLSVICKLIFHASVYEIWKQRNARLFGSSPPKSATQSIKEIQTIIRCKLAGLDCEATSLRQRATHRRQEVQPSYLHHWFEFFQRNPVPQAQHQQTQPLPPLISSL
ncbi:hypothetical protein V5N11_018269 [Cardamine amara subsp. amara]|uniref:Reverse transcriptase zinc-binding domain-containing protein n=1 Tax=Cardamine amara subsp. amara TaxID=228776 RepID=A0ABD1B578_CARAN